jgi:hypothetical protein
LRPKSVNQLYVHSARESCHEFGLFTELAEKTVIPAQFPSRKIVVVQNVLLLAEEKSPAAREEVPLHGN